MGSSNLSIGKKLHDAFFSIYSFALIAALFGICSTSYHACFNSSLSTLEKRYRFSSSAAGYVMITDNVATVLTTLFIGHYGKTAHKPRWMAAACFITGVSIILTALPYFLFGSATQSDLEFAKNFTQAMPTGGRRRGGIPSSIHMCLDKPLEQKCDSETISNASLMTTIALFCFGASNFFRGFGTSIFFTFGGPYLDDNISKAKMPTIFAFIFASRLFGSPIGLVFSSFSLKYYENPFAQPAGLSPRDPTWIGAWWIGFLVSGTLIALLGVPLSFFPAKFKKKQLEEAEEDAKELEEATNYSDVDAESSDPKAIKSEAGKSSKKVTTKLKDLPKEYFAILKNPLIYCQMLGNMFRGIGLIGFFVFQSKFIENQFRQSASSASFISGTTGILFKVVGVLFGGFFISCIKPGPKFLTTFIFCVETASVLALIAASTIHGPVYDFPNTQTNPVTGELDLVSQCNVGCNCANVNPYTLCDAQSSSNSMAFFSPCHAGCKKSFKEADNENELTYADCSCLPKDSGVMSLRRCGSDDRVYHYAYLVSLGSMISGSSRSGNTVTLFRAVRPEQKSLAVALNGFWNSLVISIPYPILYGKIFDWSCLVWRSECNKKGNCWLYDTAKLASTYHGVSIALIIFGSTFDLILIFLSHRFQKLYDDEDLNRKTLVQRGWEALKGKVTKSRNYSVSAPIDARLPDLNGHSGGDNKPNDEMELPRRPNAAN